MSTATARTVITEPEMEATYFGIPVAYLGEDGDLIALGHHSPRRALAAFNRHARIHCGLANIADDRSETLEGWLEGIRQGWAVFSAPNPDEGEHPDFVWMCHPAAADTPSAQPVTYLNA